MDKNDFIKNFADIFDETDISEFTMETKFRELDEWSSLHALATINMVELKYAKKIDPLVMKATNTVQELYELIVSTK